MTGLKLYSIFHLNLAYSSVQEELHPEVIQQCYWPLLRLSRKYNLPFGIEASGYTLETIATIDPTWIEELHWLITEGPCEFIGSGYAQIIGPLVPAEVNAANLRLGHQVYERLLGFHPEIALVNEQAYSAGLVQHYLDAGYRAIIMEWDNPYRFHPEWNIEWRYLPQIACGQHGEEIPVIWNKAIAFQKFQRHAHGEMELDEYQEYLCRHLSEKPRCFSLYGNDVEIFNFRPGRFETEAVLQEDEWQRIERLFETLLADGRFQFIRPSQVLELMQAPGAGNRLHLESPEQPIPVKKQGKYNITRWAVTGRNDIGINTACWRIFDSLKANPTSNDDDWRELCYLWSSDFRTHITEKRWKSYLKHLREFEKRTSTNKLLHNSFKILSSASSKAKIKNDGRYMLIENDATLIRLNCQRGMAIDSLRFKKISNQPLVGTLHHGYYDDIALSADFYTGHLVFESPGHPKVTDLNPLTPKISDSKGCVTVSGIVDTPLGPICKEINIFNDLSCVKIRHRLEWKVIPFGSLRLGHITLNPEVFERDTLFFSTHNGGYEREMFRINNKNIEHGNPISFLVSASQGIGITGGMVELGDEKRSICIEVDKTSAALIGFITYRLVDDRYFFRLIFSAGEIDETAVTSQKNCKIQRDMRISLTIKGKMIP